MSFFSKEAQHVEGFAKECAVVTHYRLSQGEKGLAPDKDAELEVGLFECVHVCVVNLLIFYIGLKGTLNHSTNK